MDTTLTGDARIKSNLECTGTLHEPSKKPLDEFEVVEAMLRFRWRGFIVRIWTRGSCELTVEDHYGSTLEWKRTTERMAVYLDEKLHNGNDLPDDAFTQVAAIAVLLCERYSINAIEVIKRGWFRDIAGGVFYPRWP